MSREGCVELCTAVKERENILSMIRLTATLLLILMLLGKKQLRGVARGDELEIRVASYTKVVKFPVLKLSNFPSIASL